MEEHMPRKSPYMIELTPDEKSGLESISRKYTASYYSVVRAKIVLLAAQGIDNDEIAARLELPRQIVSKWRKRFFEERMVGLEDRPRRGRPPVFSPSG
jgi:transposase-like protein